ncbi:Tumor necrosis factor ligand superfamily member 10 [Dissostichus eleginoides]|uniref:Tumor necrosis factor ligand superfamily member 10 n=1 Tax=Dissostichus eleginoides TaxID=100907 RepID=A0AAD9CD46_DISEL|nr:Tumor necrosis factor ligand superfamily member 10 [Dissostichus eleginoides]
MQAQTLFHQDLFHSFEAMKTAAPGILDKPLLQCWTRDQSSLEESEEPGFFDGEFLAQDSEVSTFVEDVRGAVKSTAGKAMCGESHWTAARETSKRANKLDEEGVEIAILWNARNQEGAGTTLGEEVEQVNSFLSRCALTTKYMAKSARTDMLTVHAMGWNHRKKNGLHIALSPRFKKTAEKTEAWASKGSASASPADAGCLQISIEALFMSICQKKHYLYRQNDRNKRRQKIVQKIAQEKKRLLEDIHKYNQQPDESMIWPWQEPNRDGVDILTKKGLFDQEMLLSRLTEEKQILVKEMMQHCQYLKDSVSKVQTLMAPVSLITQTGSYPNGITEEGYKGLMCLLRRNLDDLRLKQQTVAGAYRGILGPSPRLVEEEDEDMEEEKDWQSDNSSDDEDDAEEGT